MSFDISENNIKALKFRDELVNLLKRYNCSLSTSKDTENIIMEIYNKRLNECDLNFYTMKNKHENYNLYLESDGSCIMDKAIKNVFDRDCGEMCGLNNIKVMYGIITNSPEKAESKLKEIYKKYDKKDIECFSLHMDIKILALSNGQVYRWIKPNDGSRGYRCRKVIIDRNITLEELYNRILPICRTKGVDDVEIF